MEKNNYTAFNALDWRKWSLQLQLVTVVSLIMLATVSIVTTVLVLRQNQSLRGQLEERALTTLISIDAAISDELYFLDIDQVETITTNLAATDGIVAVRIYDTNGRLLIATDDAMPSTSLETDPFGVQLLQSSTLYSEWENDRLVIGQPITAGNQVLGAVHVELSTAELNNLLQISLLQSFIAALLSSIVGIVTVLFMSRSLTNPIALLVKQTKFIGEGNFTYPVDVQGGSNEITELVHTIENMRENLREIYVELEQRVADRTADLKKSRDEALALQRIANENSRLKSEFLSTMSHELRTPMNAIEGFTSIILKRMAGADYNDKAERYILKIQSNSKRLLGLINDFLDLSRIESGRLELAHLPISPVDMVQNWRDNLIALAENKGLTFDVHVDPNLPDTIYGDEESITKIAINLVGNAIKFTESGTVSASLEKQDDQMALIVQDTGMGIPPHARDFIFDEFRQIDQSSKRVHGGTGLGLAIVQKLVREMGGTVTLQSEVGVGSTFTVLLPIHVQAENQLA